MRSWPCHMLTGSIPALATPFHPDDLAVLDQQALARLAIRAVEQKSSALVVCGSTGEAPALSAEENGEAIAIVARAVRDCVPVIAGVGAPSTQRAASLAVAARQAGATALLVSAPPYVRPTQEGLKAHVRAVYAAARLPILLYDVPSRTGVAFRDETIAQLSAEGVIEGLKDATADLARPARLRRLCGDDFVQLSGDDATALAYRAAGGAGCISVTANLVPALCADMHAAWDRGDVRKAQHIAERLSPMHDLMFLETNPTPVKAALGLLGLCNPVPRLPLLPATAQTMDRLAELTQRLLADAEIGLAKTSVAA
ncbi:4-hydroxy-tetrahydrodipicolinate synthase [Chelatococcus asaccharovorans]|nr:4-hydroxy-tetrahydrodipicolinate synthase [Chelatococcus asaccharovorans]CAH1683213.1 4-hydroxy-tetrahydrodipicolinate synthase [Chelatococcus asaccharovorans]